MFRNSLRVLTALVLAISLCGVGVVCVDASPDLDRADGVTAGPADAATGILGWFESLIDWLLSSLSGSSCDPETDPQCEQGEGGPTMDPGS